MFCTVEIDDDLYGILEIEIKIKFRVPPRLGAIVDGSVSAGKLLIVANNDAIVENVYLQSFFYNYGAELMRYANDVERSEMVPDSEESLVKEVRDFHRAVVKACPPLHGHERTRAGLVMELFTRAGTALLRQFGDEALDIPFQIEDVWRGHYQGPITSKALKENQLIRREYLASKGWMGSGVEADVAHGGFYGAWGPEASVKTMRTLAAHMGVR